MQNATSAAAEVRIFVLRYFCFCPMEFRTNATCAITRSLFRKLQTTVVHSHLNLNFTERSRNKNLSPYLANKGRIRLNFVLCLDGYIIQTLDYRNSAADAIRNINFRLSQYLQRHGNNIMRYIVLWTRRKQFRD